MMKQRWQPGEIRNGSLVPTGDDLCLRCKECGDVGTQKGNFKVIFKTIIVISVSYFCMNFIVKTIVEKMSVSTHLTLKFRDLAT